MEKGSNHFDHQGNAWMVDVSAKAETQRVAVAEGYIRMGAAAMKALEQGEAPKGDVLGVARLGGIMGAKKTWELIPLCHPLQLTGCAVELEANPGQGVVRARCKVRVDGKTGVEMEALTGVSVALLTVYDMLKGIDKSMEIYGIRLLEKAGGKSGLYQAEKWGQGPPVVAVCGVKNSGKTTMLTKIIPLLRKKGLRVAAVKHDSHGFCPDVPGTDSYRLREAGACGVAVYAPHNMMLAREGENGGAEEMMGFFPHVDLILLEGGKGSPYPKIELVRGGISQQPVSDPATRLALCTDIGDIKGDVPCLALDDYDGVAAVILDYIQKGGGAVAGQLGQDH